ncbi:MAG: hypothetical protein OZ929_19910 [Bryobacterales bacterium]|nr:hypothetical protein [Bryobacterales bacterium]
MKTFNHPSVQKASPGIEFFSILLKEVAAQVGVTDSILNHRYPDLCKRIVSRIAERKAFELEHQRREFQAALMAPTLPSPDALSARIGIGLKHLGKIHPDLYAQYRERSDEARRVAVSNRRAAFEAEVRSAAVELIDRGLYPSRRRVLMAISNPSMRHPHILTRQVAAVLLERKLAWKRTSSSSLDLNPVRPTRTHPLIEQ